MAKIKKAEAVEALRIYDVRLDAFRDATAADVRDMQDWIGHAANFLSDQGLLSQFREYRLAREAQQVAA